MTTVVNKPLARAAAVAPAAPARPNVIADREEPVDESQFARY